MKILLIISTTIIILTLVFLLNITTFYNGTIKNKDNKQNVNQAKK